MDKVTVIDSEKMVNGWIDPSFLPEGEDKYYLRNRQVREPAGGWRHLTADEIGILVNEKNTASDWDLVQVTDGFDPKMVRNSHFYGTVRIGRIRQKGLQYHDLRLPIGITNSSIHSCDIGDDCAIHDVHYLSHYIVGDCCMLFNIQEMSTTDHAKFGNGILKEGENPDVRVRLNVMNEAEKRGVYPFDGMNTADAYLAAKYVDDVILQKRLSEMTQEMCDGHRGYYGEVGNGTVIKNSSIIKDVKIGEGCYIKGASKLKNITINSSFAEPSQIGENVILVNGIMGYGSRVFYGCIGVKFVMGNNSNLKYGARLIDSVLGDNSTISCCEVLNNLVFPCHEQHHNNSFLISSLVMGQSNIAAGATIGSNHNSRSNDGEIVAGRGFWPALCCSVKHTSRFASYVLLSKSNYQYELNIPLPFSLVANDVASGELQVMPAYWWMYNMYALTRNATKYKSRDKRVIKRQNIEFDLFAPDCMEEVVTARNLIRKWSKDFTLSEVFGEGMERSSRKVRILKPKAGYDAYGDMILHYAIINILDYLDKNPQETLVSMACRLTGPRVTDWVNMGGQLMKASDVAALIADIRTGALSGWNEIHNRYDSLWAAYPMDKLAHAYGSLCSLYEVESIAPEMWAGILKDALRVENEVLTLVETSRRKDFDNPFRKITCRNEEEVSAVFGSLDDDSLIRNLRACSKIIIEKIKGL